MKGKLIQDKYRILETLGRDTFSETFLASDRHLWGYRRYVIKKLRPILGNAEAKQIQRLFRQEARILKRLSGNHPQIPRLDEYFWVGEDFYLVREWINGLTLKQKVEQQGKLTGSEVKDILGSILDFLKYIHSYNIVYRQLKPSTIILRESALPIAWKQKPLPVPIYFGGVKELEATANGSRPYMTQMAIAEIQEYIPPEQKQGKSIFASDLYSLGMTAIYLLTGKNPTEFVRDKQTQRLLWYQELDQVEVHLVRTIERAICPQIGDRYTSAEEMLQALHSSPIALAMPKPPAQSRSFLTSEVKLVALLSALGIGTLGMTFTLLNTDFARLGQNNTNELLKTYQTETLVTNTLTTPLPVAKIKTLATADKIPASPLGMTQADLTNLLGEPNLNSRGYWYNSRALMYRDVFPEKIVLGYLTDTDTTKVRQAEIGFDRDLDLPTLKLQAKNLLQEHYSPDIDHYINQVYLRTSDRHQFEMDNLRGVVQRNDEEHIYLAIWEQGFHRL
ncbi:MAG: serine/threonine-protein kinase [Cyanobacteria bacterium J06623_7]